MSGCFFVSFFQPLIIFEPPQIFLDHQVIESVMKFSANRIAVGRSYNAPASVVWDMITDTLQWPQWGPTVRRVESADRFIRKGTRGRVLTAVGVWLPFVIVEYIHRSFWNWKVASVKATGHRIQQTKDGGSCLWFEVPIIAAPYSLVCRMALVRIENLISESSMKIDVSSG